jgi:hypothetical protein
MRIAQQKVYVLAVDLVAIGGIGRIITRPGIKRVAQRYRGTDDGPIASRRAQHAVEIKLCRRQEIIADVIGS